MGISVDDNLCVWKDQTNVIVIPRFEFWKYYRSCVFRMQQLEMNDEQKRRTESVLGAIL